MLTIHCLWSLAICVALSTGKTWNNFYAILQGLVLCCLVSPQVAPAHSSSIIPVTMVTGSELSQTLMVQLPSSQSESKKPRVGQLRETQGCSSCVESFYTYIYTSHSHVPHTLLQMYFLTPTHLTHTCTPSHIHIPCSHPHTSHTHTHMHTLTHTHTLLTPSHIHVHFPSLTHPHPLSYLPSLAHPPPSHPHTHTPSHRPSPHKASQGAQGVALPSRGDASLSCPPHTRAEGSAGGSLRQSYHVQEL